jgi:hypothetical protein
VHESRDYPKDDDDKVDPDLYLGQGVLFGSRIDSPEAEVHKSKKGKKDLPREGYGPYYRKSREEP